MGGIILPDGKWKVLIVNAALMTKHQPSTCIKPVLKALRHFTPLLELAGD